MNTEQSSAEHSPGPWRAHTGLSEGDPENWAGFAWVGWRSSPGEPERFDGVIAEIDRRKDGSPRFRERAAADARLMAAAPELLAALRGIESMFDNDNALLVAYREDIAACRAVLAKFSSASSTTKEPT